MRNMKYLGNIRGPEGKAGPANQITVGSVDTVGPGVPAEAWFTGVAPAQTLHLRLPSGAPAPDVAPTDTSVAALALNKSSETGGALESMFGRAALENPESPVAGAVNQIVQDHVGPLVNAAVIVWESLTNVNAPRPNVAGSVIWMRPKGAVLPTNYQRGTDIVFEDVEQPAPFTPADHPYLKAWWDPQHSGVGDGDPVVTVPDLSASTWTLTQPTAGLRPTLSARGLNGCAALEMTGTEYMRTLTISGGARQPSTVWAIVKGADVVNSGGSRFAVDMNDGTNSLIGATGRSSANKWYYVTEGTGTSISSTVDSDNQPRILTVSTTAAGLSTLYVNGVSVGSVTSTARDAYTTVTVGARGDGAQNWRGLIGDVVIIGAGQTPGGTFDQMLTWYANKYGIVL